MEALARLLRPCRLAAWRVGWIADLTRAAARAVERCLDAKGAELFAASGVPGLAVLVRFAAGPAIRRCFGTAGAAGPVRANTVFQVLSLSKAVTAFCALALADRGALALDEPVWRRIRSWRMPPHRLGGALSEGVTPRRILSHSAGLNAVELGFAKPGETPSTTDLLAREDDDSRTLRVVAPPGAAFRYSGAAFVLVQLLIEDVTGMPYPRAAREIVLGPLGMHSSEFELVPALAARLATRHDATGLPLPPVVMANTAASGLYATAEDLATFLGALAEGPNGEPAGRGVVSPASVTEMLTPQSVDEKGGDYGLGLHLRTKRSDLRCMHDGYSPGWYCHVEGFLRRRVVVVLLSNGDAGMVCVPLLARELRRTLYDLAL